MTVNGTRGKLRLTEEQYAAELLKCAGKCVVCGKPTAPPNMRAVKYCGPGCMYQTRLTTLRSGATKAWSKGKELVPRRPCQRCGAMFYAPPVQLRRGGGKFCSNECRTSDMAQHPERYPQTCGRRGRTGKRTDLDNRFFRSRWEANYARYLNWLKARGEIVDWEYESKTFQFEGIKRGSRFYTPDFKVISAASYAWHEVKGYMDPKSATKLKAFRALLPGRALGADRQGAIWGDRQDNETAPAALGVTGE